MLDAACDFRRLGIPAQRDGVGAKPGEVPVREQVDQPPPIQIVLGVGAQQAGDAMAGQRESSDSDWLVISRPLTRNCRVPSRWW